jgi:hypothetical protein
MCTHTLSLYFHSTLNPTSTQLHCSTLLNSTLYSHTHILNLNSTSTLHSVQLQTHQSHSQSQLHPSCSPSFPSPRPPSHLIRPVQLTQSHSSNSLTFPIFCPSVPLPVHSTPPFLPFSSSSLHLSCLSSVTQFTSCLLLPARFAVQILPSHVRSQSDLSASRVHSQCQLPAQSSQQLLQITLKSSLSLSLVFLWC